MKLTIPDLDTIIDPEILVGSEFPTELSEVVGISDFAAVSIIF
jgi:hypothetical protein